MNFLELHRSFTDPLFLKLIMPWTIFFTFALGAAVGSFLNVVIYRVPRGLSVVSPPSACPACGAHIRPWHNIPVLGWLILMGRCRDCEAPISPRYPLVELMTGLLWLACFLKYGYTATTLIGFVFTAGLVALTFIDIDTYTVPYAVVLPLIAIGLATSPWSGLVQPIDAVLGLLGGVLTVVLIVLLWWVLFRKLGMGFGDAALLGMIGSYLGYGAVAPVLLLASVQGVAVALPLFFFGRTDRFEDIDRYDPLLAPPAGAQLEPQSEQQSAPPPATADAHSGTPTAPEAQEGTSRDSSATPADTAHDRAPPPHGAPPPHADATEDADAAPQPEFGQAVIMFGPFLALAALEMFLLRDWLRHLGPVFGGGF